MTNSYEDFPEEKDGIRWLKMLGREDAIGKEVMLPDGRSLLAEDFTEVCPGNAIDLMYGLEYAEPNDPDLPLALKNAQDIISRYVGPQPVDEN